MEEKQSQDPPHTLALMFVSSVVAAVAVLITPALPEMAEHFSKTRNIIKQIVTWYVLGLSIGVFFYGPFSNRFGRKKAMYLGFYIALFGSFVSLASFPLKSFTCMNIGRFLQGFGTIAGLQVAITTVGDFYKDQKARVISSYLMLSFGVALGIAIAIGAFLMNFGAMYCYYFFVLYYIALLIVAKCCMKETLSQPQIMSLKEICIGYGKNFKVPEVLFCGFFVGSALSITYVFPSIASFIILKDLGYPQNVFGVWNFFPPIGIVSGCLLSSYLVKKVSALGEFAIGISTMTLATLIYFVLFYYNMLSIWSVFLPYILALMGFAFINTNCIAYAMKFAIDKSNGSSIFTGFCYGLSSLLMFVLSFLTTKTCYLLPFAFLAICLLCWIFYLIICSLKKNKNMDSNS